MTPSDEREPDGTESTPDRLRLAVERTLSEAMDSAATSGERTRERAQELVDDVVRRGQAALRLATSEDVRGLREQLNELQRRVSALENERLQPQPQGKPETRPGSTSP